MYMGCKDIQEQRVTQDKNVWENTSLQESRAKLRLECKSIAWQKADLYENRKEV